MDFDEALATLGFAPSQERAFGARGAKLYEARPNPYMTYTVHALDDGTAIFSWEFALGDYLAGRGLQVGSDETLNQLKVGFCETFGLDSHMDHRLVA